MAEHLDWQFYYNTKNSTNLRGFAKLGFGFTADVDYRLFPDFPTKVLVGISYHDVQGPFVGQIGHLWQNESLFSEKGLWNGLDYFTFDYLGDLTGQQKGKTYLFGDAVALDDSTALYLISAARDLQKAHPEMYSSLDACVSGIMKSPRKA